MSVILEKNTPKPSANEAEVACSGLIVEAVAVADKFEIDKTYLVQSLADVELLGLSAEYDITNKVVVYHHITEFFAMAGEGTKLYVRPVAQNTGLTALCGDAHLWAFIMEQEGEAFQCGIALNPTEAETVTDGITADLKTAIPVAQVTIDKAFAAVMPTRVILEGRKFTPPASSVADLRDLENVVAPNVSVVVAQDYFFADSFAEANNYAAVGTVLGAMSYANVHENFGWVDKFNLTNAGKSRWLKAGVSSHVDTMTLQGDWDILDKKGYIFAKKYPHLDGFRFNSDHTCVSIEINNDGVMNEHQQRYGRTLDKAIRAVYSALLPRVKSPVTLDKDGKMLPVVVASFKATAENAIDTKLDGEFSSRKVIVDKDAILLPTQSNPYPEVKITVEIQPMGCADVIRVSFSIKNSL